MGKTYKDTGVDISAGDETVDRIKPLARSTFNEKVLTDIGLFGGFFDADFDDYENPVLVSSVDGVGTKLMVAFLTDKHDTVGECLVNHCTNDILSSGAKPLFFLDYLATGKLDPGIAEQIVRGFARGCRNNGCALIGGETAEMPQMYGEGEYDISGTIVGVVDKSKIVDGSKVKKGDVLIGLKSSGLHTNGYSLARSVLLENGKVEDYSEELGTTIGEALLAVHKTYLVEVWPLADSGMVSGISHITGGGIIGNTKRIVPKDLTLKINRYSWEIPTIFKMIQKLGDVDEEEMHRVFNLGIGMILIADKKNVDVIFERCAIHDPKVIGSVE